MRNTDWSKYYENRESSFIRNINAKIRDNIFKKMLNKSSYSITSMLELGGGDSCFYIFFSNINKNLEYNVIDSNEYGVELFNKKHEKEGVKAFCHNIFEYNNDKQYDLVLSSGLIEHFSESGTADMIKKHFDFCKQDGYVLMTFPTPTFLYTSVRKTLELMGKWIYHDERPLKLEEVYKECGKYGKIIDYKLMWLLGTTQYAIFIQKES